MMTPNQYRAELKRLDITQEFAAALLGISPRTSRRWAAGHSRIHPAAADRLRAFQPKDVERSNGKAKR